jgi:hypothetical protein
VSGVALGVGRYGAGDCGVASEEEEEGFESPTVQPSSRSSLMNPPGGVIGNIRISRVVTTFISGSPSFRGLKKIASLKITFFLGRTSSY